MSLYAAVRTLTVDGVSAPKAVIRSVSPRRLIPYWSIARATVAALPVPIGNNSRGPSNMQHLADKVQETGFALLEGYQPERSAATLVSALGEADTPGAQGPVHYLKPSPAEICPSNTYSGNYGLASFPLHTDMAQWHIPPRFLMLRCLNGSAAVPTILVDGLAIIEQVGATTLARALVKPRRTVQGKRLLLRLYERDRAGCHFLRWDERYILPASRAGGLGMSMLRTALGIFPRRHVHLRRASSTRRLTSLSSNQPSDGRSLWPGRWIRQ
jgi:L-asparagine oxygenase